MLPRVEPLRDPITGEVAVPDVELLCLGVLTEGAGRLAEPLEQDDREEAMGALFEAVYILTAKYARKRERGELRPHVQFRPWLYHQLRGRLIDHWRSFYGRRGQKRVFDPRRRRPSRGWLARSYAHAAVIAGARTGARNAS